MAEIWISHTWKRRPAVIPAILAACEVQGQIRPFLNRPRFPCWVVDCEFLNYGRYRTASARRPWRLRLAGTVHLYPPQLTFWEDTRGHGGPRHSAWIFFTGGHEAGLNRLLHPRFKYARLLDATGEFGELFRRAARLGQEQGEDGFWPAQQLLCRAIALLVNAEHVANETWRLAAEEKLREKQGLACTVSQFLSERLAQRVTLGQLARHLHVSLSTLTHTYRNETGESPMTTFTRLRIERARMLVMQGVPLKAIAAQLGFSDAFHLSKTFKRVEGVAPRIFRTRATGS